MRRWFIHGALGMLMALGTVGAGAGVAHADPRDFRLTNNTGTTINEVYASPSDQVEWGEDILGVDVLPAGEVVTIQFQRFTPGNCLYDIKVVTSEGNEGELNQVNLCEVTDVTFS